MNDTRGPIGVLVILGRGGLPTKDSAEARSSGPAGWAVLSQKRGPRLIIRRAPGPPFLWADLRSTPIETNQNPSQVPTSACAVTREVGHEWAKTGRLPKWLLSF